MAEIIEVIETSEKRGKGTDEDPVRRVRQLWTKDGKLIFEDDPCKLNEEKIEEEIIKIMTEWNPGSFTVCPECHVDDFTHEEGCKFQNDDIISRLAKFVLKQNERTN